MKKDNPKYKILVEALKLIEPHQDGVKRYGIELCKALFPLIKNNIQIDLLFGKTIIPLQDFFQFNDEKVVINENLESIKYQLFKKDWLMNLLHPLIKFFPKNKFLNRLYKRRYYPISAKFLQKIERGKKDDFLNVINSYDLIHVLLPQNVLFFKNVSSKILVTCHDITHLKFPEYHTKNNIIRSEKGYELAIRKEAFFIVVSNSTTQDILKNYSVNKNKIKTILEGVNSNIFYPDNKINIANIDLKEICKKKFFLFLGNLEPRKNLLNTIAGFKKLNSKNPDIHLIIVGEKGWNNKEIKKELKVTSDQIIFLGYLSDEEVNILFNHAIALVYPSFYEGFGLPLVESMACGTPVIYGNNSAMPEVVQSAGVPVEANDPNAIKNGMEKMLDSNFRIIRAQNALKRSKELSWQKTAVQTLHYYQEIIDKKLS